jgi:hypothetical protein
MKLNITNTQVLYTRNCSASYFFANPTACFIRDWNAFTVMLRASEYETGIVFCPNGSRFYSRNEMLTLRS